MEFVCLILFLVMYFFRPQEWIHLLSSLRPVQLITFFAVYAIYNRPKGFKISDVFKTPHDWLVFSYFAWTVLGSPTPWNTFKAIMSVIIFYIVAVQALSNIRRIRVFLGWWAFSLMLVAGLALASEYGFDPFQSYDLTNGAMKGRLCLNLSIFNNPNGLGHSLVPVIPMVYFLFFWKRSIGKVTLSLLGIPFWCIYLTQSKGAFIVAFATICSTLTFGRPKTVQIIILSLAGVFGTAALYSLPRMNELDKTKNNEAIGGRVAALKFGYQCMQRNTFGIGLGNFVPEFFKHGPLERYPIKKIIKGQVKRTWGFRHYAKSTHNAYNQNGAELGYGGLALFVSILYSCMRTLITMKGGDTDEERVRRALFSVVISYALSCWMVDFCYRPTFFLFVAATGALHRILRENTLELEPEEEPQENLPASSQRLKPASGVPLAIPASSLQPTPAATMVLPHPGTAKTLDVPHLPEPRPIPSRSGEEEESRGTITWARLGWVDLAICLLLTYGVVRAWLYSIDKF